jgi:holo-[acyl-carrier protein] synthase
VILGVGVDVFAVRRMARELEQDGPGFVADVFTPGEIADCSATRDPAQHYAAKEAVVKAISSAAVTGTRWREIEVCADGDGRPAVVLHGAIKAAAEGLPAGRIRLSLSHTREFALATVIVES